MSRSKRDLRSGVPLWLQRETPSPAAALERNEAADVLVVGGGVSGALVADAALQAGFSVIAIDRRDFVRGSTPASTALLQFEIDEPLTALSEAIGEADAARAYWRSASAVSHLAGRIADLGIACGLKPRDTVYLPGDVLDPRALAREATARARIGLRSRYAEAAEIKAMTGIEADGGIVSSGCAELDPVRLTRGLWRSAMARGARLFAPVEATDVEESRSGVTVATAGGQEITATWVVLATGYELMPFVPMEGHQVLSTWAMATKPQPDRLWPSRALIWEAADPYLYMRTTPDGRVIVGGEDEPIDDDDKRDALTAKKVAAIGRKLKARLPELSVEPEFSWAGFFGESDTGLPTIGTPPGLKRTFAVMGYGGNGVTFSAVAAQLLQRAMIGLADPDADLFAFKG
ncbi:FAD-dependent oxidoreductase [Methylopila jiangsuensis]|uniref:FAD-dependent oxidoreductase n=1 Tax=Methylopila jiangsuensis TaxID=586230 RepID=A0A9W6JG99_9HYPH|nr:FAD-dependent oxidoreductase [Methylopila jiangsuensis]MDR6285721.1 glycine/D-amino acid oxidase-like deaminating enzyme [Methylopila jiangsuensis]GLK75479.1 FAD-dependent oxidoreductase [Methylopila jiangsuensis]